MDIPFPELNAPNSVSQDASSSIDSFSGGLVNQVTGTTAPGDLRSGEMPSLIGFGKKKFTDTIAGFLMGLDGTDNIYKWIIGDSSSSADWAVTTAATLTIKGTIVASAGIIGGWTINTTTLTGGDTTLDSTGVITLGTGNNIVKLSSVDATYRIWVGNATAASAPFSVTKAGAILATSGAIGGWTLGTTSFTGTGVTLSSTGDAYLAFGVTPPTSPTVGTGIFINKTGLFGLSANTQNFKIDATNGNITAIAGLIGNWTIASGSLSSINGGNTTTMASGGTNAYIAGTTGAPQFIVTHAGALTATSATITGAITATSGAIGGWTIAATTITGTGVTLSSSGDAYLAFGTTPPTAVAVGTGLFINKTGLYGLSANTQNFIISASDGSITSILGTIGGWNITSSVLRSGASDAASNVLIDKTNSLIRLGPTSGNYLTLDGANLRIRSSNYSTGVSGFTIEPTLVEAENIIARGIMKGSTFQYDIISAIGGQVYVANSDVLALDTTALDAATLTTRGTTTWAVNDIMVMRSITALGIQEEVLRVTAIGSAPTYSVTRDLAGSFAPNTNPIWQAGTTVTKQGKSDGAAVYSGGWLRLIGEGTNAPFYSVIARTGIAYNAYTEQVRMGNLNGYLDYVADIFGFAVGSSSGSSANITIDPTNGIRVRNGTTNKITFDNSGNATLLNLTVGGALTVSTAGSFASGQSAYDTGTGWWMEYNSGTPRMSLGNSVGNKLTWDGSTLSITGTFTASAGTIGGFSIGADYVRDAANSFGLASTVTGGDDVRFWAGDTFANRATAPLRITEAGAIVATSATITGAITASSGSITGAFSVLASLSIGTAGNIKSGQTAYNTGTGFFMEYNAGTPRLSIGDTTTSNSLTWDGSNLSINGTALTNNDVFGDGSDGDVTISGDTTLTTDMYYNNLTVDNGFTLNTGGYRIFVKNTLTNNGTIARKGATGGNGGAGDPGGNGTGATNGGTAGAAASALASGSLSGAGAGIAGQAGGNGGSQSVNGSAGVAGTAAATVNKSIGSAGNTGVGGGKGGDSATKTGGAASSGASGGSLTGTVFNTVRNFTAAYILYDVFPSAEVLKSSGASGGSGSGGGGAGGNGSLGNGGAGGGSGASGGTGGIVFISARILINNGTISANGGTGGNGGNGGAIANGTPSQTNGASGGGGGGGDGGTGGVVIYIYSTLTAGTITANGGTGGALGAAGAQNSGSGVGNNGTVGSTGATGKVIALKI